MKSYALISMILLMPFLVRPASAATGAMERHPTTGGTLAGVITDATTNKPVAHALVTVGYLTTGFQRATETDAHGRYAITGLPSTRSIDTYAFAQGFIYHHGVNQTIRAGETTTYSYSMARDNYPTKHPQILSYYGKSVNSSTVRFGMVAVQGDGPFSFEMLAIAPKLGRLVVLAHGVGQHYDGTLHLPRGTKAGTYTFYFVATQLDCFETKKIPHLNVHLG